MSIEYKSKHGNIVIIQNLIGTEKIVVVQANQENGFNDYFEFLTSVSLGELIEIIKKKQRNNEEQLIIDELENIALKLK